MLWEISTGRQVGCCAGCVALVILCYKAEGHSWSSKAKMSNMDPLLWMTPTIQVITDSFVRPRQAMIRRKWLKRLPKRWRRRPDLSEKQGRFREVSRCFKHIFRLVKILRFRCQRWSLQDIISWLPFILSPSERTFRSVLLGPPETGSHRSSGPVFSLWGHRIFFGKPLPHKNCQQWVATNSEWFFTSVTLFTRIICYSYVISRQKSWRKQRSTESSWWP